MKERRRGRKEEGSQRTLAFARGRRVLEQPGLVGASAVVAEGVDEDGRQARTLPSPARVWRARRSSRRLTLGSHDPEDRRADGFVVPTLSLHADGLSGSLEVVCGISRRERLYRLLTRFATRRLSRRVDFVVSEVPADSQSRTVPAVATERARRSYVLDTDSVQERKVQRREEVVRMVRSFIDG